MVYQFLEESNANGLKRGVDDTSISLKYNLYLVILILNYSL